MLDDEAAFALGAEPVAVAADCQHMAVVQEPVEDRGGDHGITEHVRVPLFSSGSHVTITDPHHFLFGHRLEVLKERSGRGPAYVVVALLDGRPRAVRIASTDLAATIASGLAAADLPRISARTLIPLMHHLSASLSLLDETVIRDDPPTALRSRCV